MAFLFYLLGWLSILAGGGVAFLGLRGAGASIVDIQRQFDGTLAGLASLAPAAPGAWFFVAGLILLAIGSALARLGVIAKYTRLSAVGLGRSVG